MKYFVYYVLFALPIPWVFGGNCAQKNCACLTKSLTALQSAHNEYPQSYVAAYADLIGQRCLEQKTCSRLCSPGDRDDCTTDAYDHFLSGYEDFLRKLKKGNAVDAFLDDIRTINTKCINFNCEETCFGGTCDIFGQSAAPSCVKSSLEALIHQLDDKKISKNVNRASGAIYAYYNDAKRCGSDQQCISQARDTFDAVFEEHFYKLAERSGSSKAVIVYSLLKHIVADCAVRT